MVAPGVNPSGLTASNFDAALPLLLTARSIRRSSSRKAIAAGGGKGQTSEPLPSSLWARRHNNAVKKKILRLAPYPRRRPPRPLAHSAEETWQRGPGGPTEGSPGGRFLYQRYLELKKLVLGFIWNASTGAVGLDRTR